MGHYLVTATLQGPTYRRFIVEAGNNDQAERDVSSEAPSVETQYNGHGRIGHVLSSAKISEEEAEELTTPTYVVVGVFTDTDDLQPFTYELSADGAREAIAGALTRVDGISPGDAEADENIGVGPSEDLGHAAAMANVRIVSVREKGSESELLHDLEEF